MDIAMPERFVLEFLTVSASGWTTACATQPVCERGEDGTTPVAHGYRCTSGACAKTAARSTAAASRSRTDSFPSQAGLQLTRRPDSDRRSDTR